MDTHTLEILEFPKVRDVLASYTSSTLGKERATAWRPLPNLETAEKSIALVTEMTEAISAKMPPPLSGVVDVRLLVRRAFVNSMLTPSELIQVKEVLIATGSMFRYRMKLNPRWHGLIELLSRMEDLGSIAKLIEAAVDNRGNVHDAASSDLANVRQTLRALDERIQNELKRLLRDPDIREALRYPSSTMSGDHHVLPVAVNYRQRIPGVVHRTSGTGDTIFVEPAIISNLNAERGLLKVEEEKEIAKVLRRLSAEIGKYSKQLQHAMDVFAEFDLITAKAKFSLEYQMTPPVLNDQGKIHLRNARHPLLLHLFKHKPVLQTTETTALSEGLPPLPEVVPIDLRLGIEFDLLIITGPNTGGKTVALKTTALCCLMAQAGMHIPADSHCLVPFLNHILADIGDEQSLEQSLSTFSAHVSRMSQILKVVDKNSLVLLDELGAGTDPVEGAALGRAILDELSHIGCKAMVTTHIGDLKTYAFNNERAENAAVEFDVQTLRPTYRLLTGQFGRSCALQIARRLKLPRDLIHRAHKYLKRRQRKNSSEIEKLQLAREAAEKARLEAMEAEREAQKVREELTRQQKELQVKHAAESSLYNFRNNLKQGTEVYVEKYDQMGQVVRVDYQKAIAVIKAGLGQWEVPLPGLFPPERR